MAHSLVRFIYRQSVSGAKGFGSLRLTNGWWFGGKMIFTLLVSAVLFFSHAGSKIAIPVQDAFFVQHTQAHQVRIVSYNVNNLFDAVHDEESFDYTFLPKEYPGKAEQCETVKQSYYKQQCLDTDWTDAKLMRKIGQIVRVLSSHGSRPDILALQEIENENVIRLLAQAAGYSKYVVTDYASHRGIDVAILFNAKKVTVVGEEFVKTPGRDPYRVQFRHLDTQETFFVYVNHWLAQSAPEKYRKTTALALAKDYEELNKKLPGVKVIALGDFNVTEEEEQDIFEATILDKSWEHRLVDVHTLARLKHPNLKKYFPDGTYYYSWRNKWRRFDRFFVSQSFVKGLKASVDLSSYRVLYSEFLTGQYLYKVNKDDPESEEILVRYPLKYNFLDNPKYPLGFSDHLPISVIVNF